jgi:predicted permease
MVADKLLGGASAGSDRLALARWLVGGAIVLLLLVSANLVNLLVARNIGRVRETAVRLALGGSRARLFRQHVMECAVLSLLAGIGALLVVQWGGPIARSALFPGIAWADGAVTGRIAALATLMSLLIGTVIAAVTTYYAGRVDPAALLNSGGSSRSTASRAHHRARLALVGAQAALSVVLLLASAGFIRSFRSAASAPLGFDVHGLVFAEVPNMESLVRTHAENEQFYTELHDRLKSAPGVEGVSLGYMNPWFYNRNEHMHIPGRDSLPQVAGFGDPAFDAVTPDYLETMRLHMRAGRWISPNDATGAAPVVVVSEALAKLYWSGTPQALGQCVQVGEQPACRQVVGVVQDIRFSGGIDTPLIPSYYLPVAQASAYGAPLHLFIRARGDPAAVVRTVRRVVQSARAGLPAADVHAIQQQMDPLLASWKLGAMAFTALGVVAATIALLGLFSVIAYLVADRSREFAIRIALGAQARQILLPVVRQGTIAVGGGAAAGAFIALGVSHWIQPLLFHVRLLDTRVVALTVGALLLVSALAAVGPARQAAAQDPVDALRSD